MEKVGGDGWKWVEVGGGGRRMGKVGGGGRRWVDVWVEGGGIW